MVKKIKMDWHIIIKLINNNLWVFFKNKINILKTIFLILPIVFIFLLPSFNYFLINYCDRYIIPEEQVFNAIAIFLTVYGIFISARVLMAVNTSQTTEILEYISHTIEIVSEAEGSNVVYIIAPTFCPGLTNKTTKKLLDNFYKLLPVVHYKKKLLILLKLSILYLISKGYNL